MISAWQVLVVLTTVVVCVGAELPQYVPLDSIKANTIVDLIDDSDPRRIPAGFSISNTSLNFGATEVFTTKIQALQLEWPSPPGTEGGQAGVDIRTKSSDESCISFSGGPIMNDGVRSSTSLVLHYHPQWADSTTTRTTIVIAVGNVVVFRLVVAGLPTPSLHHLEPLHSRTHATTLHPFESWSKPIVLWNPTDSAYHVVGYDCTNRNVRVMFVDQNDQVDPSRKNWVIPSGKLKSQATVLGSLSVVKSEEDYFNGMFFLRLQNRLTFAFFFNFSIVVPRARIGSLGVHMMSLHDGDDAFQVEQESSSGVTSTRHRQGEIVATAVELYNYQQQPLHIQDAFLRRTVPTTASTTRRSLHGDDSAPKIRLLNRGAVPASIGEEAHSLVETAPCLRLIPQLGSSIPPGVRGTVAVAVMNLTECLLNDVGSTTPFRATQRILAEVVVILAERDHAQRQLDVTLSGWVIAGGLHSVRKRSSGTQPSWQHLEHGFVMPIPTSRDAKVDPLELAVHSSFLFSLRKSYATLAARKLQGVSLLSSDSWETDNAPHVLSIGQLTVSVPELRASPSAGSSPVIVVPVSVPILSSSMVCADGKNSCLPETIEVETPVVLVLSPVVVSQLDGLHSTATQACDEVVSRALHPAARFAYCQSVASPVVGIHFGVHTSPQQKPDSWPRVVATRSVVITNPHNFSVYISDFIFSDTVSGRSALPTAPYVQLAKATLEHLSALSSKVDRVQDNTAAVILPAGVSVTLVMQLMCSRPSCASKTGIAEGLFTLRTQLKVAGRSPVAQEVSIPVAFGVFETAAASVTAPPRFDWADRKFVEVESTTSLRGVSKFMLEIEQNITLNTTLSHPLVLPAPVCTLMSPLGSDTREVHRAFEVRWFRNQTIPAGPFHGVVASVVYYPGRHDADDASTLATDDDDVESTLADAIHAVDDNSQRASGLLLRSAPRDTRAVLNFIANRRRRSTVTGTARSQKMRLGGANSAFLSHSEVDNFVRQISTYETIESCRFSFFADTATSAASWSTILNGERGLPTFFTELVDFGSVSFNYAQPSQPRDDTPTHKYVRLINTQPVPVSVQPLLWSSAGSRLPRDKRLLLQDAVRNLFSTLRLESSGTGATPQVREKAASFRIPDDVWEKPSTSFSLQGNASTMHIIPPMSSVWIGPIVYHPAAHSSSSSHRVVDRDVLLLRNNASGLDSVLVVGKVGRPVVYLGTLGTKWKSLVTYNADAALAPVALPGDALSDASASTNKVEWNVSVAEVFTWHPRPVGFPSWWDIWHHARFSGTEAHVAQLASALPDTATRSQLPYSSLLSAHRLRSYVVRGEFDSNGNVILMDEEPNASSGDGIHSAGPIPLALKARLPIYFVTTFQVINKGSFLLNMSSLTFANNKCTSGELRLHPCLISGGDAPSATTLQTNYDAVDASWNDVAGAFNLTTTHAAAIIIPPRCSVTFELFRFPQFFDTDAVDEIVLMHNGQPVRFPVRSTLPTEMFAVSRFSNLKTFSHAVQHAITTSFFVVIVGAVTVTLWRRVWAAQPVAQASSGSSAAAVTSVTAPKASATAAAGATKAQVLASKKARKEAWELYHHQQRLQQASSNAAAGIPPPIASAVAPSDAQDMTVNDQSSSSSSRSSSVPVAVSEVVTPSQPTKSVEPPSAYDSQRHSRIAKRARQDILTQETQDRDRIITEQLAFIGQTLLEWNSSSEVRAFTERVYMQRLERQQEEKRKAQEQAAQEAAAKEKEAAEFELRRQDAELRRQQAEDNLRKSEVARAQQRNASQASQQQRIPTDGGSNASHLEDSKPLMPNTPPRYTVLVRPQTLQQQQSSLPAATSPPVAVGAGDDQKVRARGGVDRTPPRSGGDGLSRKASDVPPRPVVDGSPFVIPKPRSTTTAVTAPTAIDHDHDHTSTPSTFVDDTTETHAVQQLLRRALSKRDDEAASQSNSLLAMTVVHAAAMGKASSLRQRLMETSQTQQPTSGVRHAAQPLPSVDEPRIEYGILSRVSHALTLEDPGQSTSAFRGTDSPPALLSERLPSNFTFEEPPVYGMVGAAAMVGDYDAFFSADAFGHGEQEPHSTTSPRLYGGSPLQPQPATANRNNAAGGTWDSVGFTSATASNGHFNVFGGHW